MEALEHRIYNQRNELAALNKRCQELENRLNVIYRCDYIKSRLQSVESGASYRYLLTNRKYRRACEDIFGMPFDQCRDAYDDLLRQRNGIVHKYTQNAWQYSEKRKRVPTGRTLTELATRGY
jgi:hypothetical protein